MMRMTTALGVLLLSFGVHAAEYRIDPVHTRVSFSADHAGFSQAIGTFSAPRGRLSFDPDDWTQAELEVELDVATLDLGDADWNERMLRRDFLDAERHPLARFTSTRVEAIDGRRANVHGELSLAGRVQPLTLEVTLNRLAPHPMNMRRTAGFSARATLSRHAFGISAWPKLIADEVTLRIEVEAQRSRKPRDDESDATEE